MKKMVLIALCLLFGCFVFAGCSSGDEPFEEKVYTPVKQVREINLDVQDREIEVALSEDEQVHIKYFENSDESYDISISDENVLTMNSTSNKGWSDFISVQAPNEARKILLQIPDALLESLTISTTNEDISISKLTVTDGISITSNGGNIAFDGLDTGISISLTAKNGDIEGTVIGGWDDFAIKCNVKKGDSNLPESKDGGEKVLNVSGNNGDVNIEFVKE